MTDGAKSGRDPHPVRFPAWALVVLLSVSLCAGALVAYRARTRADHVLRTDLLAETRMVAHALNRDVVARLSEGTPDANSPDYLQVKALLSSVRSANPGCRFLYLLQARGNDILFLVDSEPPESKDHSPPGQLYTEVGDEDREAVSRGIERVTGPAADRWGAFVSALVPIKHPATGRTLAVLGMDVDARDWASRVNQHGLAPVVVTLLAGTVLVSFFVLLRRSDLGMRRITAAAEAQATSAALFQRERNFTQLLLDTSPALIVAIGFDGKTLMMNRALLELLEYTSPEIAGADYLRTFVPEEDRDALASVFQRIVHEKQATLNSNRIRSKSGRLYLVEWRGRTATVDEDGQGFFVGIGVDITERKQAEAEREHLEARLRQSQKMEAVGQLAGGVAHDFNNLLQAILGYAEIAKDHLEPDTAGRQAIDEVHAAAERAAGVTRQLLAFSRRQIIQPIDLDLNGLVEGIWKMLRRVIGEQIELRFLPGEHLGTVHVDKGQIEQVLVNLCVNARDAMPKGGTLTIETERTVLGDAYLREHPWATPGPYVVLRVTDTGHGMDEHTRAQIFVPFFTTKTVGQGTGLGLATVYGIVKQHQGSVDVVSAPGRGSTFTVNIPAIDRPAEEAAARAADGASGGSETILVAEDEEVVRSLIVRLLEQAGYTVVTAVNGDDAMRVFAEHADTVDLAILDVVMPGLGGREVMGRIQARDPRVRFLFSSGYSASAIHQDFVVEDGLRLITKPYARADLLRAVREVLDRP